MCCYEYVFTNNLLEFVYLIEFLKNSVVQFIDFNDSLENSLYGVTDHFS